MEKEMTKDEQRFMLLAVRIHRALGKTPFNRGMMDIMSDLVDKVEELESQLNIAIQEIEVERGY